MSFQHAFPNRGSVKNQGQNSPYIYIDFIASCFSPHVILADLDSENINFKHFSYVFNVVSKCQFTVKNNPRVFYCISLFYYCVVLCCFVVCGCVCIWGM